MGEAAHAVAMTEQEYLAFERASDMRHEFADGVAYAMSGGTREHSLVGTNIAGELRIALRDRPCEVHGSDMRIKVARSGRYTYADAVVVCGRAELEDEVGDTLLNPTVVVEVLSDSSERYDRGEKFAQYRSVESLRHYVLASQRQARIEVFTRAEAGAWVYRAHGPGEPVRLEALGCSVDVDAVYRRVFDEAT
jgi:Uma2 family endonuclease